MQWTLVILDHQKTTLEDTHPFSADFHSVQFGCHPSTKLKQFSKE